jgi:hypothetical protein
MNESTTLSRDYKVASHAERYISSIAGGAMLGAIAGMIGTLIGGVIGAFIANNLSKKEQ